MINDAGLGGPVVVAKAPPPSGSAPSAVDRVEDTDPYVSPFLAFRQPQNSPQSASTEKIAPIATNTTAEDGQGAQIDDDATIVSILAALSELDPPFETP